jgi:hypothetical protein
VDPACIPQVFATKTSAELARRIAWESITLLENQLPQLRAGDRQQIVVISNGSTATVDEDNAVTHSPSNHRLSEQLRRRVPGVQASVLSTAMKPEEIERAFVTELNGTSALESQRAQRRQPADCRYIRIDGAIQR